MRNDSPHDSTRPAPGTASAEASAPAAARAFARIAALVLCAMALVSFTDVCLRLLGRPVTGAYELTGLLMGLLVYATLPLVTARDDHVRAGVLQLWRAAPPWLRPATQSLRQWLTALAMGYLAVALAAYMQRVAQAGDRAPFIEVPLAWVAGFGALALALSAGLALGCWWALRRKEHRP